MSADAARHFSEVLTRTVDGEERSLTTLCQRTLELLPVSGAAVVLMGRERNQGLVGAFGATAAAVQDVEFTLGEGPGIDAFAEGRPVMVDDLHAVDGRWPQFSPSAAGLGVRAVTALPLQVGAIRLGVLILYRDQPGALVAERLTEALLVADLLTHLVLAMQSDAASESLAWALDAPDYRVVVHQATGMVSAQLNCGVEEALVRLRGHAFAAERPIDQVAEDVVEGSLRFEDA
ncbi:MAG: GAF domain-containing protein [Acidimicrobiales bacterium]